MFWIWLFLFLLGHVAAAAWFRSGRPWVGVLLVAWLWVAVDAAVVLRFLFDPPLPAWRWCVWAMGAGAAALSGHAALVLLRRRSARVREQRLERYREGLVAFMGNDLRTAASRFRGLVRRDPWDQDSWAALQLLADAVPGTVVPAPTALPEGARGAIRQGALRRSS